MINIGDEVRLVLGWTRMVIIGIRPNGDLIAKYDRGCDGDWSTIRLSDYEYPEENKSCVRPRSGFVAWDGSPAMKDHIMPVKTYRLISDPLIKGVLRGHTKDGFLLLEVEDGQVYTMNPQYVELDIPYTFSAKEIGNKGRTCHFTLPAGASVCVGDVLCSDGGNMYSVTKLDTKFENLKWEFKGVRLITEVL